jgi:serine/threonine protein kinase
MTVSNSSIQLGRNTMLYCPKCRSNYQDETQRFCPNDGGRLSSVPDSAVPAENSPKGVFTNLLSRSKTGYEMDEKLSDNPRFFTTKSPVSVRTRLDEFDDLTPAPPIEKPEVPKNTEVNEPVTLDLPELPPMLSDKRDLKPVFRTSRGQQTFANALKQSELPRTESIPVDNEPLPEFPFESAAETEIPSPELIEKTNSFESFPIETPSTAKLESIEKTATEPIPLPHVIQVSEVPNSQAELGNRELFPTGRLAISKENPNVLLGQTVKGRYYVEEKIGQDDSGISFIATDKLTPGKRVVVRVLMDEDSTVNAQLNDERVSLSHLNHPHIASLFDSGELLEGRQFLITEFVEGKTLRELMIHDGKMNPMRVARIVRQIGYALSDAHHNGILHRNLRPESVILGVSEIGAENVKIVDFCETINQSVRNQSFDKIGYWSPEHIEGKSVNFSSDVYSLAVITFEMLTGKRAFSGDSAKSLLDLQKQKLKLMPSRLQLDLPAGIDEVIQKGLNYNPEDRYPRARDFGEALFNIVNSKSEHLMATSTNEPQTSKEVAETLPLGNDLLAAVVAKKPIISKEGYLHIPSNIETLKAQNVSGDEVVESTVGKFPSDSNLWEKRSPEPPKVISLGWLLAMFIGVLLLIAGVIWIWSSYLNKEAERMVVEPQAANQVIAEPNVTSEGDRPADTDYPPPPRVINKPEGFVLFQNSKQRISSPSLLKGFRGFSLYYPTDWTKVDPTNSSTYFVDVKKTSPSGLPIEQLVVEPYPSKGTYKEDFNDFPSLVKRAESELQKQPNYQKLDERETTINNDRKVYEVRWVAAGETKSKEMITIWGRTLFMPAQRRGIKTGLRITMVASSLSNEVKNIDDVGVKGSLASVLATFEPDSLD